MTDEKRDPKRILGFTNDGFTFPVTDEGPLDGDVVVLLHGFPQTSKSWDAVCALLNESGYRTLRFDQRGYAPNARPRGRRPYRSSALTGDVAALIADIGSPVHLVGHDWGSAVAWATAASKPALLKSLTAVSVGHPAAFQRSMLSSNQALRSYYMLLFQIPRLPEAVARRYPKVFHRFLSASGMTAEAIEAVQTDVVDGGALTGGLAWYRAIAFQDKASSGRVSVPTTYVWSTGDVALGRRAADLTERYVTGPYRFEVVDGSHWIPEEQPELLHRLIVERAGES
jgi:pimeloyl-ACP methyl ester carboxylesterase